MTGQGSNAEKKVKSVLEKEFSEKLSEKKIPVGKKGKYKSFDLVSDDGEIVIEVKSYKLGNETTGKSGYSTTRKQRLITALWYLERVKARRRILVLTNKELYGQFMKDIEGLLSSKTEIRCIPMN